MGTSVWHICVAHLVEGSESLSPVNSEGLQSLRFPALARPLCQRARSQASDSSAVDVVRVAIWEV